MGSYTRNLASLFERALEARERIYTDPQEVLAELNREVVKQKLGGRLIVLSVPEEHLSVAYRNRRHSHLLPSGRLGGFAVRYCDETEEPELVTIFHDVRGMGGNTILTKVTEQQTPYDVNEEQMDCGVLREAVKHMAAPDFSFPGLATLCKRATDGNLGLALFVAALNDLRLPYTLASAIYTPPAQVFYFANGIDVGPAELPCVRYRLDGSDMFSMMAREPEERPSLHVTNMLPDHPMVDFRDILIDHDVIAHESPF